MGNAPLLVARTLTQVGTPSGISAERTTSAYPGAASTSVHGISPVSNELRPRATLILLIPDWGSLQVHKVCHSYSSYIYCIYTYILQECKRVQVQVQMLIFIDLFLVWDTIIRTG